MQNKMTWLVGMVVCLIPSLVLSETRLQVNTNANQFPYVTVRVRAFDSVTGKGVAAITKEKFVLSEDLSAVKIDNFKHLASAEAKNPNIDVMFVFDETGSMADEIEGLLQRTQKFADSIARSGINFRLGLVTFSDIVEKKFAYTEDVAQFKKNVAELRAIGGEDEPENQLDALIAAMNMPSRDSAKRVFILVTDATYHFQDRITNRRPEQVIAELKSKGIQLHVVGPELDSYKNMSKDLTGNFYDKDSDDFSSIVATIGGDISANYEFSFQSPRSLRDGTRRSVRVALYGEAATDSAQYVAPWFVTASSRQDALIGDESPFAPNKVLDGNSATAWFPSNVGMSNDEWINMSLPVARTISKVSVAAAVTKKFTDKNTVVLSIDGGDEITGEKSADGSTVTFVFSKPKPVSQLRIALRASAGTHLGISEVTAYLPDGSLIPEIAVHHISDSKRESAKQINERGEKTFHAGKVAESVKIYLSAIEADPEFAQAYSNLGLSYWKLKDYPKSIEANRTAIALGKQQGKPVVMASSYYNIARTFEEQKEYKQALMNFWWANKTTPKPVYEKAIQRMNTLIAKDAE